ncbi:hypothetical protein CEW88_16195 [Alloyangia pacifica]|uniref:Uncharacterized protein n=1 Tax=Alloyangia pacifica TaxID=311180 RepID=A0A2U8HI19_9RHOB|nr:hypothetical protein CEW88_16195 [Alloyangia pacifica]
MTAVIDRQHVKAIYFSEPGGVLFACATDPPGLAADEPPERAVTTVKRSRTCRRRSADRADQTPEPGTRRIGGGS